MAGTDELGFLVRSVTAVLVESVRWSAFSISRLVMGWVRKRATALRVRVGRVGETIGAATGGGRSKNLTRSKRLNFDGSNSSSASLCWPPAAQNIVQFQNQTVQQLGHCCFVVSKLPPKKINQSSFRGFKADDLPSVSDLAALLATGTSVDWVPLVCACVGETCRLTASSRPSVRFDSTTWFRSSDFLDGEKKPKQKEIEKRKIKIRNKTKTRQTKNRQTKINR